MQENAESGGRPPRLLVNAFVSGHDKKLTVEPKEAFTFVFIGLARTLQDSREKRQSAFRAHSCAQREKAARSIRPRPHESRPFSTLIVQ
jgi:hypothetical protein